MDLRLTVVLALVAFANAGKTPFSRRFPILDYFHTSDFVHWTRLTMRIFHLTSYRLRIVDKFKFKLIELLYNTCVRQVEK
jgi:hypothetical protein